ncbi:coiled-coil membrane protein [Scheffersomyces coipomensis]|uniref:coiled-coil membrane protein n=1 Tax=Scheffersomyces coipomensis TaxID=1788519 RepID=UPI00315D14C2
MLDWIDLQPYTLLVSTFLILAFQQVINQVGKSTIQELVWSLYMAIGSKLNLTNSFKEYSTKQIEIVDLNKQKRLISAQDQYAKWTKLNRQVDKLTAELTQLKETISKDKSSVNSFVSLSIMLITTAPLWFFRLWFRKSILFYLPPQYLPYALEWVFSIPFFPLGSVGLTVWTFAVKQVISSIIFLSSFPFQAPVGKPVKKEKVEEVK